MESNVSGPERGGKVKGRVPDVVIGPCRGPEVMSLLLSTLLPLAQSEVMASVSLLVAVRARFHPTRVFAAHVRTSDRVLCQDSMKPVVSGIRFAQSRTPSLAGGRAVEYPLTDEQFSILFDPFLTWNEIEDKLRRLKNANRDDRPSSRRDREEEPPPVPSSRGLQPVA